MRDELFEALMEAAQREAIVQELKKVNELLERIVATLTYDGVLIQSQEVK